MSLTSYEIIAGLLLLFILFLVYYSHRKPKGFPPGPLSLPIIGNLHQIGTRPFEKFLQMKKQYGSIFAIDFGSLRGVVLTDYKVIREALSMSEFSGRPRLRPFLETCGGIPRDIALNDGSSWAEHRRFALRHLRDFGFGKKSMEALIQDEIEELLVTLTKMKGKPFQTKTIFNLAMLNGLMWILVGERFSHDDKKLEDIAKMFSDGFADSPAAGAFLFFPWLSRLAPNITGYNAFVSLQLASIDFIKHKFIEQKATFQDGEHRHFIDVCIQQINDTEDPLSSIYGEEGEHQFTQSVADLFMTGIETAGTTLSWTFLLLALNQNSQERLYEEIKSVVGQHRLPLLNDEQNTPYAEAVITEVLRYSSIVPLAVFHSTTEDVIFHGYKIPKDTLVIPNLYGANHDPEVWGDPEIFRPERFLTEDGKFSKMSESFLPFSSGKRACLGEGLARNQLFLFITSIFQKFKILPDPSKPTPIVDYTSSIVLQPKPYDYILIPRE